MERANPFSDLSDFQATPKAKPVQTEQIERLAEENGFPSRQSKTPTKKQQSPAKPKRRGRRYTTGRNQQINIKATAETIEQLYRIADEKNIPLGKVLDLALQAIDSNWDNKHANRSETT